MNSTKKLFLQKNIANNILNNLDNKDIQNLRTVNKRTCDFVDDYRKTEFLKKYNINKDKPIDWKYVSRYHKLDETFMTMFADKLDWILLSQYQTLSEPFIIKFGNRVDWELISIYQNVSESFKKKYCY